MNIMLRTALLGSVAAATLAGPNFALAQSQPAAKASDAEVGEVVVTGSRIRRPDLTSVQPIQVITTETIEERGFTNVADALNEAPSSGIPINPIGDQGSFGTGRNYINIFNLGSNRTLTLVNGRRFVSSNAASIFTGAGAGGQVDLNGIPTGLVDRIETIQASGGAIYGSDAVAGVINIITKRDYDGLEFDGRYGVAEDSEGKEWRARITGGKSWMDNRLNLSGSYEYNKTSALAFTNRDVTARQLAFANNPQNTSSSDGIPGSIIILNRRIPEVTQGGLPSRAGSAALSGLLTMVDPSNPTARIAAQFAPNGELVPFNTGTFYQASIASGGDGLNLAELSSLQSPVERHVVTGFAKYEFNDNIRLTSELFYSKQSASEPFNQPIYNAPLFGGNSSALRMSTANPFLSPTAKAALLAQPTALTADTANPGNGIFFLSRASTDIGTNKTEGEGESLRVVVNLEGDFDFLGHNYAWNVAANQGRSEGSFRSPNIDQAKFLFAIDAVRDTLGNIVCRDVTARAAGCVPLNLFGKGAPSKAALNYVQVQFQSDFELVQTVYEANLNGDLFDLPAGAVSAAIGWEARKEESSFTPNDPQRLGIGRSAAISALAGEYDTKEYYGELVVPIFGGDFTGPLAKSLELEGSYRKIDHSQAGEDKAWSYGLRWKPVDSLLVRGSKSRSFRAPAITEVNLPNATSFMTATDPCDSRNIATGPNPAARQANCQAAFVALGLPASFSLISQVQAATVQGATSGNLGLVNELADQWTAGFVFQPSFVPGLAVSMDWVNIDLTNAIAQFSLTSIMQVCYDSPSPPAATCSRFQRGNSASARPGQVLTNGENNGAGIISNGPQTGFINAGYTQFQGFTFGVDYKVNLAELSDIGDWLNGNPGSLGFNFDLYHVNKQQTSVSGLGFDLNDDKGEIGNADLQWKLETTYKRDPLSIIWTTNYIGKSKFNNDFTLETRAPLAVDDYYINDLAFAYKLDSLVGDLGLGLDNATARLVVRNVGNVEAPFGTTGLGVYDVMGRYYQFGLTARF